MVSNEIHYSTRISLLKSNGLPSLRRIFCIKLLILSLVDLIYTRKLDDIYWNSSNTIFDISNTQHVRTVKLLDRVTIVCPHTVNSNVRYEYTKLFMVPRELYERCELREGQKDVRQLGVCATPYRQSSISIVFRPFSALSSGLQFRPGRSYYVITTSDGTERGLNKSYGGLCLTRNMKLKFDLLPDESESDEESNDNAPSIIDNSITEGASKSKPQEILYEIHTSDSLEVPAIVAPMTHSISSIFQSALRGSDVVLKGEDVTDSGVSSNVRSAPYLIASLSTAFLILRRIVPPVIL